MDEQAKGKDLIKARKQCNIFRFIYDLNCSNDVGEFKSSCSNIYPEELQLGKEKITLRHNGIRDLQ